jgi:hypothetical protein
MSPILQFLCTGSFRCPAPTASMRSPTLPLCPLPALPRAPPAATHPPPLDFLVCTPAHCIPHAVATISGVRTSVLDRQLEGGGEIAAHGKLLRWRCHVAPLPAAFGTSLDWGYACPNRDPPSIHPAHRVPMSARCLRAAASTRSLLLCSRPLAVLCSLASPPNSRPIASHTAQPLAAAALTCRRPSYNSRPSRLVCSAATMEAPAATEPNPLLTVSA